MKWGNTLFAFEKDIESRGFWDWMRAHTSWMKPLYRYEGLLEIIGDKLLLVGEDKEGSEIELEIPVDRINDIHFGFDETFRMTPQKSGLAIDGKIDNEKFVQWWTSHLQETRKPIAGQSAASGERLEEVDRLAQARPSRRKWEERQEEQASHQQFLEMGRISKALQLTPRHISQV